MVKKSIDEGIKIRVVTLLETAQGRVKLLKAGLTGKEIENLYIRYSGLELVSVNRQEVLI